MKGEIDHNKKSLNFPVLVWLLAWNVRRYVLIKALRAKKALILFDLT
jgi:hypothetical protein